MQPEQNTVAHCTSTGAGYNEACKNTLACCPGAWARARACVMMAPTTVATSRVCLGGTNGGGGCGGVVEGAVIFLLIFLSLFVFFPLLRLVPFLPCPLLLLFLPAVVPVSLFFFPYPSLSSSSLSSCSCSGPSGSCLQHVGKFLVAAWRCAIQFAAMWSPCLLLLLWLLVSSPVLPRNMH